MDSPSSGEGGLFKCSTSAGDASATFAMATVPAITDAACAPSRLGFKSRPCVLKRCQPRSVAAPSTRVVAAAAAPADVPAGSVSVVLLAGAHVSTQQLALGQISLLCVQQHAPGICAHVNFNRFPTGGVGKRMGANMPKQYLPLRGQPIATYSLRLFAALPSVGEIVVVCDPSYRDVFTSAQLPRAVPLSFALPGKERQDSVFNGLQAIRPAAQLVAIHDSARPLVTRQGVCRMYTCSSPLTTPTSSSLFLQRLRLCSVMRQHTAPLCWACRPRQPSNRRGLTGLWSGRWTGAHCGRCIRRR